MSNQIKLGFGDPPPVYIYVGEGENQGEKYPWYKYDTINNSQVPIYQRALTGYVTELKLTKHEYKGKFNFKLNITVLADTLYIVRCGIETNFARGFCLSLRNVKNIKDIVTIVARPGETGKVVFCNLYNADCSQVKSEWDGDLKLFPLVSEFQKTLGNSQQTMEDINNEFNLKKAPNNK